MNSTLGVKGLIELNNRILVLLKSDGTFDLPGGRVEPVESFLCAPYREVLEETGLSIQIMDVLAQWGFLKQNGLYISGLTFMCWAPSAPVSLSDEHCDFTTLDRDEVSKHPCLQRFFRSTGRV